MYTYVNISALLSIFGAMWWFLSRPRTTTLSSSHHVKLPPGPRGLPVIGNLHLLGSLPHRSITALAKKYGPIMSLRLGYVPAIVVSSPKAAELFLRTHDTTFASRPRTQSSDFLSYGNKGVAFTPYGSYWRDMRKFCVRELLSVQMVDSLAWMRREELGSFVKKIGKAAEARVALDLTKMVEELIQDMICRMLFGRSRDERFNLSAILQEFNETIGAFNIADYLPFLRTLDLQGLARRVERTRGALDKAIEVIIDEHELNGINKRKNINSDFVDALLSMKNELNSANEQPAYTFDRTNVKAMVVDMIFAGMDTSYAAAIWVMTYLIKNPRVMIKLQKELQTVVGENDTVKEAYLSKLDYLHMVVKESFRLHPVVPLSVPHESTEDIVIDGYFIPKKSRIIINNWALGRDPNVWSKNAEEFFPERFIGSKIDLRGQDFQLIPFSSGRRGCPGMHLGLINVQLLVAHMVHCFDWELPTGISANELEMDEKFGITMSRRNHLIAIPNFRGREKLLG